jgi:hypothetical protein
MTVLGLCAYPECREPVEMRVAQSSDRAPVSYGKGFYEHRTQGGANAFVGGVERIGPHVWHRACAIRHRDERRYGRQETFFLEADRKDG